MADKLQILSLLLIGITGAEARYKCPDYDAIRTPGVAAGNFSLADFTGANFTCGMLCASLYDRRVQGRGI